MALRLSLLLVLLLACTARQPKAWQAFRVHITQDEKPQIAEQLFYVHRTVQYPPWLDWCNVLSVDRLEALDLDRLPDIWAANQHGQAIPLRIVP